MAKTLKITFKQESVIIGKCTEFTKSQNEYTAVRYQDNHCPVEWFSTSKHPAQHSHATCYSCWIGLNSIFLGQALFLAEG